MIFEKQALGTGIFDAGNVCRHKIKQDALMDDIVNPHDKLFRQTWSDLETAKSFLHHYLPKKVLALTELDTLEICKDSFVEKDL